MPPTVLITGGAGFIGSHAADELLAHGYAVRALDNLSPQVHGDGGAYPNYLDAEVELLHGDVQDADAVRRSLRGVDMVLHLAAAVGVGQSMYEIGKYTSTNNLGTAVLLEALLEHPVERLVVASSMSIYGEGLYRDVRGQRVEGTERPLEQLRRGAWELSDGNGGRLEPVPTPESKQPSLSSVYALSKYDQERLCLMVGRAYGIPTVALRFFNVYGSRQSLSNPYTGVLAIFAARYLNGNPPVIYEDGRQRRDFVSVQDVARACRLALETPGAAGEVLNIGSGESRSVREVADLMAEVLGQSGTEPAITGKYRAGDIRHCFADITLARKVLGFRPEVELGAGLAELAEWLSGQLAVDRIDIANEELSRRGLTL
jgi:dTDP-L-rhamnose 4-epimerase